MTRREETAFSSWNDDDGIPLAVIDFSSSLINCVYYFSTICRVSRDVAVRILESKLNGKSCGDGRQREQSAVSGTAGGLRRADVPDQVGDTVDYGEVFAARAGWDKEGSAPEDTEQEDYGGVSAVEGEFWV